ncbi:MAG: putative DNA-binding domain-containing protein [Xanthobacteraceae bacterium]
MPIALQDDFALALLNPEQPVPDGVTSHTDSRPQRRFAVYRNNVIVSLVEALRMRFPATERIVGAEFFAVMARVFVASHPPRSPMMMRYGDELAAFLETFEPVRELSYLPDIVRLEAARTRAYHAADAEPLDAEDLQSLDLETLWNARAMLHPSLEVVRSPHPIVTIWGMNSGELALGPVDMDVAEDALVARPALAVQVRSLPAGGAALVAALAAGANFGAAVAQAEREAGIFDLAAVLAVLIGAGALTDIVLPE